MSAISSNNAGSTIGQFMRRMEYSNQIAYALVWLYNIDILERMILSDGIFHAIRSAISKGGIIFTDAQSFQYNLDPSAFKYKVVSVTRILQLRSKAPREACNDVLSKIAAVLDPSSCLLVLGTCQLPITLALNALCSNVIPSAAIILSPLSSVPISVWNTWLTSVVASPLRQFCFILNLPFSLDVVGVIFGILRYWVSPFPVLALPAPQMPAQNVNEGLRSAKCN
ncbi:MAG: hypothetical protein ACTS44_01085 [Candidatus Hodgkinia cicadicola]